MDKAIKNHMQFINEETQNSLEMHNEILDSLYCGVFSYTVPEYKLLTINDEARRIIGCGPDDDPIKAYCKFLEEKVDAEDKERAAIVPESIKEPGDSIRCCYKAFCKNKIVNIQMYVKMLAFPNGQRYILNTMLDMTEQMGMANALSMERKTYKEIISSGSEFSFSFDLTEGMVYEDFITTHGVSPERNLGIKFPVSIDKLNKAFIKYADIEIESEEASKEFTQKSLLEKFERGITNTTTEYYSPDSDAYTRLTAHMHRDTVSSHIMAFIVASDITDIRRRDRAQKLALKEANEKLSRANDEVNTRIDVILNGISGGLKIIDVDKDYQYVFISEGAAKLQGYTVDEFLRKFRSKMTSNIHPLDAENTYYDINKQVEINGVYSVKYRVEDKNGNIKWVLDRGKLITDENGRKFYYVIIQDITDLEDRNSRLNDLLVMQKQMSDSLGSGVLAYTIPEHKTLILNQETRRIFGFDNKDPDLGGYEIMKRVIPEDIDKIRDVSKKLVDVNDWAEYVFHVRRDDGSIVTVKTFTKRLSFDNGQEFILSSMSDITKREIMEKNLVEERRQYRDALAFDSELFFTLDITEGYFQNRLVSKKGEDLIKKLGIVLPMDYDSAAALWFAGNRAVFLKGNPDIIRSRDKLISMYINGTTRLDVEYYLPSENRYFNIQVLLSESALNGHINAGFFVYDVTSERKEERRSRSIIYSIGRIYCTIFHFSFLDNTYIIIRQHEDIAKNLCEKGTLEEFRRDYIGKMVEPEFKNALSDFLDFGSFDERFRNIDSASVEYRRVNLGWCRGTIIVGEKNENGELVSAVMTVNIIEEQKKEELTRQEALRTALDSANVANAAKTKFLANMSHDIRTPMNAIIGMTAIAETHIDDRVRVSDCLSKIAVSSKHLLGLINDILDMSKIESGKFDIQEEAFNLPDLIDNLLVMSNPLIAARGHTLTVSIHSIEHEDVIGDSQHIQQAFMNIMSNAIKYTPDGGEIKLTICEKVKRKKNVACYEFVFEDNGIGMSKEFVERIFDPFVRDESDKRISGIRGTGLGMPITRNIVQLMNGDIKVESELDKGTKITVDITLALQDKNEKVEYEQFEGLSVLVVDHDENTCISECGILKEIGMKGDWAVGGRAAVEKVAEAHETGDDYFAIILCWKMKGMDGVETTGEIRKLIGYTSKIVLVSENDMRDVELEARAAGANAFMSKPLFKSRLVHLFNELVGEKEDIDEDNGLDNLKNKNFTGKRALLVEDNELNAEIAGEILGMAGLEIEYAVNGKEAFDRISSSEDGYYDVVFMDIQMPVMNGYESARAIRSLPGEYTKKVPIIAMTANAFAEDVAAAKNAGMNEHIAKPLDFNQLYKALKKWLK